jgi:hypothetical protein
MTKVGAEIMKNGDLEREREGRIEEEEWSE